MAHLGALPRSGVMWAEAIFDGWRVMLHPARRCGAIEGSPPGGVARLH